MALKLEPIIPPPVSPPPPYDSKPAHLSFQNPKPYQQQKPLPLSLTTNHTHFSPLDQPATSTNYSTVLQSCKCPNLGEQIHAHAVKNGFRGDQFVETKLLQMYRNFGYFDHATQLFDEMPNRNLHSWTAILSLYLDFGCFEEAFSLFRNLQFEDINLNFFVFPQALKICTGYGGVELGSQFHGMVIKSGFISKTHVRNALIDMYGKCRSLDNAKRVFHKNDDNRDSVSWNSIITACAGNGMTHDALKLLKKMPTPNLVSWNAVLAGFSQNGHDEKAIEILQRMVRSGLQPNPMTLASVLPACARLQTLILGREIHGYITRRGLMLNEFLVNGLIDVYRRCSNMGSALHLFSKFSEQNEVSFNTMIVGYFENGEVSRAEDLFDKMEFADVISFNSMISGYVDNYMYEIALDMFKMLVIGHGIEANSFTLGSVLAACADLISLRRGKEIHSYAMKRGLNSNPFVGGALIEMYCKCHDLKAAQTAFEEVKGREMPTWNALISGYARCNQIECIQNVLFKMKEDGFEPNEYTWNGIIAGYVENGHHESALNLFNEMMQISNLKPDIYTIGTILSAISKLATIEKGKQVHGYSIRHGYDLDTRIGAALVDMYAKCGSIKHARTAYNRIKSHNLVTRNVMLTAYAMHGHGKEGIAFFRELLKEGVRPDGVTFLSVLSSCVHEGSVELGREFFDLMGRFEVVPTVKHYTCIVDLLSRAGSLHEAYKIVEEMPEEADSVIWGALLGGCVIHGEVDLGERAATALIELEPENTGNYVMLANLYASGGRWIDLARTRQMMKDKQLQKTPGCSWIEDRDEVNVFVACDISHRRAEEIYETLDHLTIQMKLEQD